MPRRPKQSPKANEPSRAANSTPAGPAALPPTATALAVKAKDLEALRGAVVDAAGVSAGLWLSYLFVLFYLLVAAGSVTHRDLFLESPIKLPFLNVELPLTGFFWLGPALFLVAHAYVLVHFVLLAQKVGVFHAELEAQIRDSVVGERLRRQLPSNIFVQFLAGPREVRTGVLGFLLRLVAQISLVVGPVALLVFFQLQFLPYHDWVITWWHRFAVLIDILLLWALWPSVARGRMVRLREIRGRKAATMALASLVPLVLVFWIATFPGEWLDGLPSVRLVPTGWPEQPARATQVLQVNLPPAPGADGGESRKAGAPSETGGKRFPFAAVEALFERVVRSAQTVEWTSPYALLVAGEVDPEARKPKSLRSNYLVLPGADLIDRAKFDSEAKLAAARETVSLRTRHLERAVLIDADLRKADFTAAWLQGASLFRAQLQGASLDGAQLQGANLFRAKLQGASFFRAQLQGARLAVAQLQGASLDRAQLQGAQIRQAFVWRADVRHARGEDAYVFKPEIGRKQTCPLGSNEVSCDWSAASFEELRQLVTKAVSNPSELPGVLGEIGRLDPAKPLEGEAEMANAWISLEKSSPSPEASRKNLAKQWREAGCAADGAPYVVRALLSRLDELDRIVTLPSGVESPEKAELARAFLDEEHCPGARGLTGTEKTRLKAIRDRAPTPAPSPEAAKQ